MKELSDSINNLPHFKEWQHTDPEDPIYRDHGDLMKFLEESPLVEHWSRDDYCHFLVIMPKYFSMGTSPQEDLVLILHEKFPMYHIQYMDKPGHSGGYLWRRIFYIWGGGLYKKKPIDGEGKVYVGAFFPFKEEK